MKKYPQYSSAAKYVVPFLFLMLLAVSAIAQEASKNKGIEWYEYDEAKTLAAEDQKKIMLFMEAEWCTICKQMKREVFPDENIQSILNEHFYAVSLDIESDEKMEYKGKIMSRMEFSKNMKLYATPTFIFLNHDESIIGNKPGFIDTEELADLLRYIHTDAYLNQSYKEFIEPK